MIPTVIDNIGPRPTTVVAAPATIYSYQVKNENGYTIYVQCYDNLVDDVDHEGDTPDLLIEVDPLTTVSVNDDPTVFATGITMSAVTEVSTVDPIASRPSRTPIITLQLAPALTGAVLPAADAEDENTIFSDSGVLTVSTAGA